MADYVGIELETSSFECSASSHSSLEALWKMNVDYSLYLVTDSTPAVLGDRDLVSVVSDALHGGVTIVQYRDKSSETADLIRMAERLHTITSEHKVPLLINDRVDVALAVGAEGVHLGQDDMSTCLSKPIEKLFIATGYTLSSPLWDDELMVSDITD